MFSIFWLSGSQTHTISFKIINQLYQFFVGKLVVEPLFLGSRFLRFFSELNENKIAFVCLEKPPLKK